MSWTPKPGMVLKHKTIRQTVEVLGRFEVPGMVFWEVDEAGGHGVVRDRPWMIHEPWLIEQYEPKEETHGPDDSR